MNENSTGLRRNNNSVGDFGEGSSKKFHFVSKKVNIFETDSNLFDFDSDLDFDRKVNASSTQGVRTALNILEELESNSTDNRSAELTKASSDRSPFMSNLCLNRTVDNRLNNVIGFDAVGENEGSTPKEKPSMFTFQKTSCGIENNIHGVEAASCKMQNVNMNNAVNNNLRRDSFLDAEKENNTISDSQSSKLDCEEHSQLVQSILGDIDTESLFDDF